MRSKWVAAAMLRRLIIVLIVICPSGSPSRAQSTETDQAAIRAALTKWTDDFNAGNVAAVCGSAPGLRYDYKGFPERGYQDICDGLRGSLTDQTKRYHYSLEIKENRRVVGSRRCSIDMDAAGHQATRRRSFRMSMASIFSAKNLAAPGKSSGSLLTINRDRERVAIWTPLVIPFAPPGANGTASWNRLGGTYGERLEARIDEIVRSSIRRLASSSSISLPSNAAASSISIISPAIALRRTVKSSMWSSSSA